MFERASTYLGELFKDFSKHAALTQSAAIAFYTALSFAPLVLLLVSVGGFLGDDSKYELIGQFSRELGPRSAELAHDVVTAAQKSAGTGAPLWRTVIGLVGLFIAASAVFGQLQSALNDMWAVVAKPHAMRPTHGRLMTLSITAWGWLRKRLLSMGMVLVVLFILLVSMVVSAALGAMIPMTSGQHILSRLLDTVVSFIVAAVLFAAIFKVLPDASIRWKHACLGAAITSVLFIGGKFLLSLYIDKTGVGKDYGEAVGGLVALLVWVYYSSAALLLGAEATHLLSDTAGDTPTSNPERRGPTPAINARDHSGPQ